MNDIHPRVEWISDYPLRFKLLNTFEHYDPVLDRRIVIPRGFVYDGASWIRPHAFGKTAPLVHDWLYQTCGLSHEGPPLSRRQCDLIFYRAALGSGCPWWRAEAGYHGVRVGGWAAWRNHARRLRA